MMRGFVPVLVIVFALWVAVLVPAFAPQEPTVAFNVTGPAPPTCFEWRATSCEPLVEGEDKPVCTFTVVRPIADPTAVCLGTGCAVAFGPTDVETLHLTIRGEVAKFCGDPAE